MEARLPRIWYVLAFFCVYGTVFSNALTVNGQQAFQTNTENFVVYAPDPNLAKKAAKLAEHYRRELSIDWLGYEIKPWREKCPIHIQVGPHAGGETSFAFIDDGQQSEPIGWRMQIFGPPDRLLDAVLPHEITHTIFATHFGRPLPRWADEGACTTVEHYSEREKNHRMLMEFLTSKPSRGIPFNRMFTMKRYPHDILPLYAQGYSVARFLIAQNGRHEFIKFLEAGLAIEESNYDTGSWDQVVKQFYGFKDLSDLQVKWLTWVGQGSPDLTQESEIASGDSIPANDAVAQSDVQPENNAVPSYSPNPVADQINRSNAQVLGHSSSWYARQSRGDGATFQSRESNDSPSSDEPMDAIDLDSELFRSSGAFLPGSIKRVPSTSLKPEHGSARRSTVWR